MTAAQRHMLELAAAFNERRIDRALEELADPTTTTRKTPTPEQAVEIARIAAAIRRETERIHVEEDR